MSSAFDEMVLAVGCDEQEPCSTAQQRMAEEGRGAGPRYEGPRSRSATVHGTMASSTIPYIGSKISLISNSNIRYEGILYTINTQESTIALQSVRSFGTEGRKVPEIPPSSEIYDFIIFRGQDIKDLTVLEGSGAGGASPHLNDPAIMSMKKPAGGPGPLEALGKAASKGSYGYGESSGGWGAPAKGGKARPAADSTWYGGSVQQGWGKGDKGAGTGKGWDSYQKGYEKSYDKGYEKGYGYDKGYGKSQDKGKVGKAGKGYEEKGSKGKGGKDTEKGKGGKALETGKGKKGATEGKGKAGKDMGYASGLEIPSAAIGRSLFCCSNFLHVENARFRQPVVARYGGRPLSINGGSKPLATSDSERTLTYRKIDTYHDVGANGAAVSMSGGDGDVIYTNNPICIKNRCVNPLTPGLNDLPRLGGLVWQCSEPGVVQEYLHFCRAAVDYDPAVPSPENTSTAGSQVSPQGSDVFVVYRHQEVYRQ
eukprot:s6559_g3.t1